MEGDALDQRAAHSPRQDRTRLRGASGRPSRGCNGAKRLSAPRQKDRKNVISESGCDDWSAKFSVLRVTILPNGELQKAVLCSELECRASGHGCTYLGFHDEPIPDPNRLNKVWVLDDRTAFAVGNGGTVLRYDGVSWKLLPQPDEAYVGGLWASAVDDLYVTSNGSVYHHDGSVWSEQVPPHYASLVWGLGEGEFLAAGRGAVSHYKNGSWTTTDLPVSASPSDLWATDPDNVYLVTHRHIDTSTAYLYHFDGATWDVEYSTDSSLYSIHGSGPNNIYAMGVGGSIVHYDGDSWSELASATTASLKGVWASNRDTVFVVGDDVVLFKDVSGWKQLRDFRPEGDDLADVHGAAPAALFAVGSRGETAPILARYAGSTWADASPIEPGRVTDFWGATKSTAFATAVSAGGGQIAY